MKKAFILFIILMIIVGLYTFITLSEAAKDHTVQTLGTVQKVKTALSSVAANRETAQSHSEALSAPQKPPQAARRAPAQNVNNQNIRNLLNQNISNAQQRRGVNADGEMVIIVE